MTPEQTQQNLANHITYDINEELIVAMRNHYAYHDHDSNETTKKIGALIVQMYLEEQRRQKAEDLLPHLAERDPVLQSFEQVQIKNVIVDILSQREEVVTDWRIHLGFHPDLEPDPINQPLANTNFQISGVLIQGNDKHARYPF